MSAASAAVAIAAVAATGAFFYYSTPSPVSAEPPAAIVSAAAAVITVHVSGAVVAPGLVEVAPDARIADVVAAAGGTANQANLEALNLAAPVHDGEQVVVPVHGADGAATANDGGRVRLNSASASELEQIPGVGPVLAGRIIEARQLVGGFTAVEDLLDVSGIGEAKLAALRDHVTVP